MICAKRLFNLQKFIFSTCFRTSWMNGFQTNTGGNTITIHYDPTARVDVSGQLYPLSNLERGDVIDVTLEPNGSSNYLAQSITLVRNVRQ